MNAGYVSLLLALIAMILFASGWKDYLIRGITPTSLLLFFISWIALALLRVDSHLGGIRLHGPAWVYGALFAYMWIRARGGLLRFHLLSVSMLLGALYFFLTEMLHLMPTLIIGNVPLTVSLCIGLLNAMLLRLPAMQIAAVSGGLLFGEAVGLYMHQGMAAGELGTPAFHDLWWLSAFISRAGSLVLEALAASLRRVWRMISGLLKIR
ncbi:MULTISPECIES: hypothetical protein [unclassified Paenibacillus]|uniref:YphA family membrane protein n=1 Tax=unclassified Paenibacillus TaxID=185978 RepID=UPI0009FAD937|nr:MULTISPECIES: hypothetical protein [unclassified Paenibacillus]